MDLLTLPPDLQKASPAGAINDDQLDIRTMPNALGPEKSVLSSMLKNPAQWITRAKEEELTREHFYHPGHGMLFDLLSELNDKGTEIELVSLVQLLNDRGLLENIGGLAGLQSLYTYAPNAAHFLSHLQLVKDKFTLRSIIQTCTESISEAYDNPEDTTQLLDRVERDVLAIREGNEISRNFTMKEAVEEVYSKFQEALAGGEELRGISTGYADLDNLSKGFKPGEMIVIAARPSMGKTSLMMNIVEHICVDQGIPSLVFSCEMTAFQIVQRLVFSRARMSLSKMGRGFNPTKSELQTLKKTITATSNCKMVVDDTASIPIDTLRAKARRRKRENDIGFIAIDYLQLLRSHSRQASNSREREIGEISAGIKALAKELNIPILVLAQLNRGPENRTGSGYGRPRMSDLRESGTIEQDADMVGLLYRTAYYLDEEEDKESEEGKAELVIAKNRNGETGHVPLTFLAEYMRFESRARDPE